MIAVGGDPDAWFAGVEVFALEQRAAGQITGGDEPFAEGLSHFAEGVCQDVLIGRACHSVFDEPTPLDELFELLAGNRRRHIGPEHIAAQGHMDFEQIGAEGDSRQAGVDGPRMVGQPDGALEAVFPRGNPVEPKLFRRAGIGRRALKEANWYLLPPQQLHGPRQFRLTAHPTREQHGPPSLRDPFEQQWVIDFARSHLPCRHIKPIEQLDRGDGKRRANEEHPTLLGMLLEVSPLDFTELHPSPIVISRRVLAAELDSPRFFRATFRGCNMRLEFHRIGPGPGHDVDQRVRHSKTAVVRLGDFGNDQRRLARSNGVTGDFKRFDWRLGHGIYPFSSITWAIRSHALPSKHK